MANRISQTGPKPVLAGAILAGATLPVGAWISAITGHRISWRRASVIKRFTLTHL
jgi:hypothetical protein